MMEDDVCGERLAQSEEALEYLSDRVFNPFQGSDSWVQRNMEYLRLTF